MFDVEKYKKCIHFLQENNTHQIAHSNSNFFNHLIRTFNILRKWNQPDDVCFAGMFHNVYGNQYFNPNLNINREQVKNLIGEKAEKIAYDFHYINRDTIIDSDDKEQIVIMLANEFDQKKLLKVMDNNYDPKACREIYTYFCKHVKWEFGRTNDTFLSEKWTYDLNFKTDIEKLLQSNQEFILKKTGLSHILKISRVYASANQFGHYGELHVDENVTEYNEKFTLMYYLNPKWDISWAGETCFLNEQRDEIENAIIPKPARAVLFDAFIKHGSRPLNKVFVGARMVLTFKYELK